MKKITMIITGIIMWLVVAGTSYVMFIMAAKWFHSASGMLIFALAINIGMSLLFSRILLGKFRLPGVVRKAVIISAIFAATWLVFIWIIAYRPLPAPLAEESYVSAKESVSWMLMDDGDSLAYMHFVSDSLDSGFPLVYLHPGPGAFAVQNSSVRDVMETLARKGISSYIYDRPGAGLSVRYSDPGRYERNKQLDVLGEFIGRLGEDKVWLLGESYGAMLASRFASSNPDKVAGLILISPGPLYNDPWNQQDVSLYSRLPLEQKKEVNRIRTNSRVFTALLISQRDPATARRFLSDEEADPYFSHLFHKISPGGLCDSTSLSYPYGCCGFWSSIFTARNERGDTMSIEAVPTLPVLIARGKCDYLDDAVIKDYIDAFPKARKVILNAGHFLIHEQADSITKISRDFMKESK